MTKPLICCFRCRESVTRPSCERVDDRTVWCACGQTVCPECGQEMLAASKPGLAVHRHPLPAPRCPAQRNENAEARRAAFLVLEGGKAKKAS